MTTAASSVAPPLIPANRMAGISDTTGQHAPRRLAQVCVGKMVGIVKATTLEMALFMACLGKASDLKGDFHEVVTNACY